jgi:perosamine synthetase
MSHLSIRIPHNRPTLGPAEAAAANRVIQSGWLAQGNEVEQFEMEFASTMGLGPEHAVAVSSGTAALFLALWSLDAHGKNIGFPAYSCSSLRHAVGLTGGCENLLDIASEGPNVESTSVMTAGIVIAAHLFGFPLVLSDSPNVIEDCAQVLGAKVGGSPVGLNSRIAVFSFSATKIITSGGQGGMLLSRDRELIDAVRDYRAFDGRRDDRKRFNFQMTDLQAAIARVQLTRLPEFLARRAEIVAIYEDAGLPLLRALPGTTPSNYRAIVKTGDSSGLIGRLAREGIRAIVPIEPWEIMASADQCPNAHALASCTVSLPVYPGLSTDSAREIATISSTALSEQFVDRLH